MNREEGPYRSEPLWNEGQAVARMRRDNGAIFAIMGAALGGVLGGFLAQIDRKLGMVGALLGGVLLGVAGHVLGKRQRRDFCSADGCAAWLPQGGDRCPTCGGRIVTELASEADARAWRHARVPSDEEAAAEMAEAERDR